MSEPDRAWCGICGVELEPVRPGKHQHPDVECEPISNDEAT